MSDTLAQLGLCGIDLNMSRLSPQTIVDWFRQQAREYNAIADRVERDLGLKTTHSPTRRDEPSLPGLTFSSDAMPHPDAIRQVMGKRKMRLASIAAEMHVTPEMVQKVIDQDGGFERGERGWISVKGPE